MSFCFFPTFYICIKCERKEASLGKAPSRKQHKKILVLQSSGRFPSLVLPCSLQNLKKNSKYYVYRFKFKPVCWSHEGHRCSRNILCQVAAQEEEIKRSNIDVHISSGICLHQEPWSLLWDSSKGRGSLLSTGAVTETSDKWQASKISPLTLCDHTGCAWMLVS